MSPQDSTILALQKESVAFFDLWNTLWKRSQTESWKGRDGKTFLAPIRQNIRQRQLYAHCHAPGFVGAFEQGVATLPGKYQPVRGEGAFSVCPTWLLSETEQPVEGLYADEADDIDAAIGLSYADSVRTARAKLLASYDSAQVLLPANAAVTGQRVRLLLDQKRGLDAQAVARECNKDVAFCLMLQGYVASRRGELLEASTLFDDATGKLTKEERCGWRDIGKLLPDSTRDNYALLTCTPRKEFAALYWWLADPLYSDSINERLVENDARAVRMLLLSGLPRDERFLYGLKNYEPQALQKLVARYGWPTYLAWGGRMVDEVHTGWLKRFHSDSQPPYTTYEYSKSRIHTAPPLSVLYSPLSATDSSWEFYDPKLTDRDANWWPDEHMTRARPLLTLPSYQIAMLRRENDILLASAHDVTAHPFSGMRNRSSATLIVSPGPDKFTTVASRLLDNSPTVRMSGRIPSARTMFAMEIRETPRVGMDARTRVGIEPPSTLKAMKPGDVALSEPVVLQANKNSDGPLEPSEALLGQMLGSTTISLADNPRIGVFFESYGVREGDTVNVSVTLRRRESVSVLRRLGIAVNVADDPNVSVTISWAEPNPAHVTRTVGGTVPIQSRAISLDISGLAPGPYELVTGIKKGKIPEVTSSRRLVIVK